MIVVTVQKLSTLLLKFWYFAAYVAPEAMAYEIPKTLWDHL